MKRMSFVASFVLAIATLFLTVSAPTPAQAGFGWILNWNPFGREVKTDEPTPTGSVTQLLRGRPIFVWDSPMSVYPEVIDLEEDVILAASAPTPGGKGLTSIYWSNDPMPMASQIEDERVWHRTEGKIIGGQHVFSYRPVVGLNVVRILLNVPESKEVTYRPMPFVKWGKAKNQVRGVQIHFNARDAKENGSWDPLYLVDGKLDERKLVQALYKEGMPGRPILLNWRGEKPIGTPPAGPTFTTNGRTTTGNGAGSSLNGPRVVRFALHNFQAGQTVQVFCRWHSAEKDALKSEVADATKGETIAIPEGVKRFAVFVWVINPDGTSPTKQSIRHEGTGGGYVDMPDNAPGVTIKLDATTIKAP